MRPESMVDGPPAKPRYLYIASRLWLCGGLDNERRHEGLHALPSGEGAGYDIALTQRRSPVRIRPSPLNSRGPLGPLRTWWLDSSGNGSDKRGKAVRARLGRRAVLRARAAHVGLRDGSVRSLRANRAADR